MEERNKKNKKHTKLHKLTCLVCKQDFGSYRLGTKTCSDKCYRKYASIGKTKREIYKSVNLPDGCYLSLDGYIILTSTKDGRKKFPIHRYIIEQKIGRKLLPDEIVHHKNENKLDNRVCNLQILSRSQHIQLHMKKRKAILK